MLRPVSSLTRSSIASTLAFSGLARSRAGTKFYQVSQALFVSVCSVLCLAEMTTRRSGFDPLKALVKESYTD